MFLVHCKERDNGARIECSNRITARVCVCVSVKIVMVILVMLINVRTHACEWTEKNNKRVSGQLRRVVKK